MISRPLHRPSRAGLVSMAMASVNVALLTLAYLAMWTPFYALRGGADDLGLADRGEAVATSGWWIGGGIRPNEYLQDWLYEPGHISLLDDLAFAVHQSYFAVPWVTMLALAILWCAKWQPGTTVMLDYLLATGIVLYVGLLLYALVPTSPPWLIAENDPALDVIRITALRSDIVALDPNPRAAMPSLHLAITAVVAWSWWRLSRWLGIVGALYTLAMGFTLVYLGEHYVLDLLVGLVLAGGAIVAASLLLRWVGAVFLIGTPPLGRWSLRGSQPSARERRM